MNRDDLVSHDGRLYFLRGVDPAGVFEARAYLEDAETGERVTVLLEALRATRDALYEPDSAPHPA